MWSDWIVFCDYGFSVSALWWPLATPTILLGFLLHWTWSYSSWPPADLRRGVAPLGRASELSVTATALLKGAAAAAKLLQSCPTLCSPIDCRPPGSPIPWWFRQEHWSGLPFPSAMHESLKGASQCEMLSTEPDLCLGVVYSFPSACHWGSTLWSATILLVAALKIWTEINWLIIYII